MAVYTNNVVKLCAQGMNLELSINCGQTFSWQEAQDGWFEGVADGRSLRVKQQGEELLLWDFEQQMTSESVDFWRHYFALNEDYAALEERFKQDEKLAECVACAGGIRVFNQPFFEVVLSFILSQNNNIPRIMGIAQRLREQFGTRMQSGLYAFPTAKQLAEREIEELAPLRAGFRAKYLLDAARKVASGQVNEEELRRASDDEARKMLMQIVGVGPKVADCVLLYGLGRKNIVPMDVWMKRAMQNVFGGEMPPCAQGSEGIAQQYVFHWARTHMPKE